MVGALAAGLRRRNRVRKVVDTYDSDVDAGRTDLHLETPESRYGALSKLLLPLSGQWNAGTADARFARKNNAVPSYGLSQGSADIGSAAASLGLAPFNLPFSLAGGYGGHISAGMDKKLLRPGDPEEERLARLRGGQKTAAEVPAADEEKKKSLAARYPTLSTLGVWGAGLVGATTGVALSSYARERFGV